ncbi:hypothetical protein MBLNU459_g0400t1 [Dothideomycetes sp. NU459]
MSCIVRRQARRQQATASNRQQPPATASNSQQQPATASADRRPPTTGHQAPGLRRLPAKPSQAPAVSLYDGAVGCRHAADVRRCASCRAWPAHARRTGAYAGAAKRKAPGAEPKRKAQGAWCGAKAYSKTKRVAAIAGEWWSTRPSDFLTTAVRSTLHAPRSTPYTHAPPRDGRRQLVRCTLFRASATLSLPLAALAALARPTFSPPPPPAFDLRPAPAAPSSSASLVGRSRSRAAPHRTAPHRIHRNPRAAVSPQNDAPRLRSATRPSAIARFSSPRASTLMSTLASSRSPANSPRSPFLQRYSPALSSQRPSKSPRPAYFSSPPPPPPARSNAPAAAAADSTTDPSPTLARTPPRAANPTPETADAGTQYTPKGLPPTAVNIAGCKRKGSSPLPSMTPSSTLENPPPEPDPRTVPARDDAVAAAAADGDTSADGAVAGAGAGASGHTPPAEQGVSAERAHSPSASKKPRTVTEDNVKIMPLKYETCSPKDLGYLISNMLMELIRLNDQIPLSGRLTRFHSRAPPGISCHDYLQRLIQHATLSPPILLSMVYYIDRLCALYPAFNVSSLTVHRFLITAATVAAKGLSDSFWTNPTYARIGGISTSELATLEMEFLQKVQWRIVPKPEVLVDYYASLVGRSEGYEMETPPEQDPAQDRKMDTDPP